MVMLKVPFPQNFPNPVVDHEQSRLVGNPPCLPEFRTSKASQRPAPRFEVTAQRCARARTNDLHAPSTSSAVGLKPERPPGRPSRPLGPCSRDRPIATMRSERRIGMPCLNEEGNPSEQSHRDLATVRTPTSSLVRRSRIRATSALIQRPIISPRFWNGNGKTPAAPHTCRSVCLHPWKRPLLRRRLQSGHSARSFSQGGAACLHREPPIWRGGGRVREESLAGPMRRSGAIPGCGGRGGGLEDGVLNPTPSERSAP